MKISLPKISPISITRISVLGLSLAITTVIGLFLYFDFYKTIIYAQDVVILKQDVLVDDIDIEKFNSVYKTHQYKIKSVISSTVYDPFETVEIAEEEKVQE